MTDESTTPGGATPAGWYPDPTTGQQRYWDGTAWTDHVAPAAQSGFCTNCGASVHPQAGACTNCGFDPRTARNFCRTCGTQTVPGQVMCLNCGSALGTGYSGAPGSKSKVAAGLFAIFLGSFGVHKFYLGRTGPGVIMLGCWLVGICGFFLVVPIFLALAVNVVALIEGIIYLTKSDADFEEIYVRQGRDWF